MRPMYLCLGWILATGCATKDEDSWCPRDANCAKTGTGTETSLTTGSGTGTGTGTGSTTGTGTGTTTGTETTTTDWCDSFTPPGGGGAFSIAINWTDDGQDPPASCNDDVVILIRDPMGRVDWNLGMAQDGAGGWSGEDCINGTAICHPISAPCHQLRQVSSCDAADIVAGSRTFVDASAEPFLTYFLEDATGSCYVFGTDTAYYAALSCTEIL